MDRYGKRYETADEMKHRFSIFLESLETIRSHNKKGLSYTLGVNGKYLLVLVNINKLESKLKTLSVLLVIYVILCSSVSLMIIFGYPKKNI